MITNKDQYIKTFLHIDLDAFYASVEQLDFQNTAETRN